MSNHRQLPPSFPFKLLAWFCPDVLYEGIEGDLSEQFEKDFKSKGYNYAKRRLLWNAIRFFHPEIILRNQFTVRLMSTVMMNNYFKVTLRNMKKRKLYSFINSLGLSIGIAFCILIYLFIQDERSFDQFHVNKELIFRIEVDEYNYWNTNASEEDKYVSYAETQLPLMQVLKEESPVVEFATRYSGGDGIVKYQEKVFTEDLKYVDPDFFRMFSFKLLSGNAQKLFEHKLEVVVTSTIARKYFGNTDPIGKSIQIDNEGEKSFIVSGVIEPAPSNSSISYDILLPIENRPYYERQLNQWGTFNTPTIVQLRQAGDISTLRQNLEKITESLLGEMLERWRKEGNVADDIEIFKYNTAGLSDWHLKKEVQWEKVSDPKYALILGGIALLILLIACINYISLALTSSAARRTEVGVRKVMGAIRRQLVFQFGFESLALSSISLLIAMLLAVFALPVFNEYTSKSIVLNADTIVSLLGIGLTVAFLVGILAGSYPALFLSAFKPVTVLKNHYGTKLSLAFTTPLVVLQFALSAFLIISSLIMYRQMQFITTMNLGYNGDQILVVQTQTGWNDEAEKVVNQFRNRMMQEPDVVSVAGTSSSFNRGWSRNGYSIDGVNRSAFVYAVDPYYLKTLDLQLVNGRNFNPDILSDSNAIIVNEALVRDMDWIDPTSEYLNYREDSLSLGARVIGVVKDYHNRSLEAPIQPVFLSMDKEYIGHLVLMMVKISSNDIPMAVDKVHAAWNDLYPDKPFDYTFLDQDVARQYESQQRWMSIMGLSTGFAILISCLGLFGLSGINAVNRTKEIGIRKVMGAGLINIITIMNRQFVWLSLTAFLIAIPFSYFIMSEWLSKFEFKIEMEWSLFAMSMALGVLIALATVSYHAIKAALTNPAETLKYE